MKKLYLLIISLIFCSSFSFAQIQGSSDEYYNPGETKSTEKSYQDTENKQVAKSKPIISYQLGSQFSTWGNKGFSFTNYLAPSVKYDLSPKIRINTGVIFMRNNYSNLYLPTESGWKAQSGAYTSTMLFTEAEYKFNEKLKITGAILYGFNNTGDPFTKANKNFNNNLSYLIGGEYKITENLRVGFEVRKGNGFNPYSGYSLFDDPYGVPYRNHSNW